MLTVRRSEITLIARPRGPRARHGHLQTLTDLAQLLLGLGRLIAQALGGHLGPGDSLTLDAQSRLNLGLLLRAGTQLSGDLLARSAVLAEQRLYLLQQARHRLACAGKHRRKALGARRELEVGCALGLQTPDPPCALGPFCLSALSLPALRRQLTLQLGATHRQWPLLRRGLALLDQPERFALSLCRLAQQAFAVAQRAVRLV